MEDEKVIAVVRPRGMKVRLVMEGEPLYGSQFEKVVLLGPRTGSDWEEQILFARMMLGHEKVVEVDMNDFTDIW